MHGVVDLRGADPAFERVAEAGTAGGEAIPRVAVVRRDIETVAHAARVGQTRAIAAEVAAQISEALFVAVQDPAGGLRKGAGGDFVVGIAGAIAAEKVGGEGEAGVGGAAVLGPIPVGQGEVGVAGSGLQLGLVELEQFAMPGAERRSAVRIVGTVGIV